MGEVRRGGTEIHHRRGVTLAQGRQRLPGDQKRADQIDPQHLFEISQRGLRKMRRAQDPGDIDQGVQTAESLDRLPDTRRDRGLVTDIDDHGAQPAGGRAGLGARVGQSGLADIGRGHGPALGEHAQDARLADARAATGDQDATIGIALHGGAPIRDDGLFASPFWVHRALAMGKSPALGCHGISRGDSGTLARFFA